MIKILNNLLSAGFPAFVLIFGLLCFRYWWQNRKERSVLLASIFAVLHGLVTISNLAINAHGRFFGRYTWGPRYIELETLGIVLLVLSFLSLAFFVSKKGNISAKKPVLLLVGLGGLSGIVFFLLETFG